MEEILNYCMRRISPECIVRQTSGNVNGTIVLSSATSVKRVLPQFFQVPCSKRLQCFVVRLSWHRRIGSCHLKTLKAYMHEWGYQGHERCTQLPGE